MKRKYCVIVSAEIVEGARRHPVENSTETNIACPMRRIANSANGSPPIVEPVCDMPKRKLENGEQRLAWQNLGFGPKASKISGQRRSPGPNPQSTQTSRGARRPKDHSLADFAGCWRRTGLWPVRSARPYSHIQRPSAPPTANRQPQDGPLRALALFGRRPPQCEGRLLRPASKNLHRTRHYAVAVRANMQSILVAMMKSFSCSPLIFLVCKETVAFPQPKLIFG
jgi:hypothetical protein